MMTQAFYTGVSGIKTNQSAIDVVANNIANISTYGFRASTPEFASLFEKAISTTSAHVGEDTVGVGSRMQATTMNLQNGSLILTERSTDLAISGDGWFGVQSNGNPLYTRDGSFTFDANNDLVTTDGYYVLGTMGKNIVDNVLTSILPEVKLADVKAQEKLQFPKYLTYPAEPSTSAKFFANVGVGEDPISVGAGVVDPMGNKNHLQLVFTKNPIQNPPGSQWSVVATTQTLDGLSVYDTKTGTVEFGAGGDLLSTSLTTIDNNGATVNMNLGLGYSGIVSINRPYEPGSSTADGAIGGVLQGYQINQDGEVIATFTNGKQSGVGKIAVYHFQNDQGLERTSSNRFSESINSGDALFYKNTAGENIIGTSLMNYRLETSNVRMEVALTELIIYQKAFDASSKCVSTADQMIQKALNMAAK